LNDKDLNYRTPLEIEIGMFYFWIPDKTYRFFRNASKNEKYSCISRNKEYSRK
jgi:hypothetical protein